MKVRLKNSIKNSLETNKFFFLVVLVIIGVYSVFPKDAFLDTTNLIIHGLFFFITFFCYFIVSRLNNKLLNQGWQLTVYGFLGHFLGVLTAEPAVFEIIFEGLLTITGMALVAFGLIKTVTYYQEYTDRYQSFFNTNHSIIILINPETGMIVDANQAALSFYGYSREELIGEKITKINTSPDKIVFKKMQQAQMGDEMHFYFEHKLIDGDTRQVEVNSGPISVDGKTVLYSIVHDITEKKEIEAEVKKQQAYFSQLFNSFPDAIVMLDNQDQVMMINKGFEDLFGYSARESQGRYINDLIVPLMKKDEAQNLSKETLHGGAIKKESIRRKKDGELIDVAIIAYPILIEDQQRGIYVIYQQISERKRSERALKESESKYRTLFENANDAIFLIEYKPEAKLIGNIIDANQVACKRLGYSKDEMTTFKPQQLISPGDLEETKTVGEEFSRKGKATFEITHVAKDGQEIPTEINALRCVINDEEVVLSIARDITERKQAAEKMWSLSFRDQLTGLYNRRYLENEIERLSNSRLLPISLIMADLDELKIVNDTLGHKIGDKVIKAAGDIIKTVIRDEDIAARVGGDEFVIILPETGEKAAVDVCQRIEEKIGKYPDIKLSISTGSATKESYGKGLEQVLIEADKVMYKTKRKKKSNRECYDGVRGYL